MPKPLSDNGTERKPTIPEMYQWARDLESGRLASVVSQPATENLPGPGAASSAGFSMDSARQVSENFRKYQEDFQRQQSPLAGQPANDNAMGGGLRGGQIGGRQQPANDNAGMTLSDRATDVAGKGVETAGKGVEMAGKSVEMAGKGVETAGKGIEYGGKGVEMAGKGMEYAGEGVKVAGQAVEQGSQVAGQAIQAGSQAVGQGMQAGGQAMTQGGSSMVQAGVGLSSTGLGAIAGVPLAIVGGAVAAGGVGVTAAGAGTQAVGTAAGQGVAAAGTAAGKGMQAAGEGTKAAGKGVQSAGKGIQEAGKATQEAGKGIKSAGESTTSLGKNIGEVGSGIRDYAGMRGAGDTLDMYSNPGKLAADMMQEAKEGTKQYLKDTMRAPGGGGGAPGAPNPLAVAAMLKKYSTLPIRLVEASALISIKSFCLTDIWDFYGIIYVPIVFGIKLLSDARMKTTAQMAQSFLREAPEDMKQLIPPEIKFYLATITWQLMGEWLSWGAATLVWTVIVLIIVVIIILIVAAVQKLISTLTLGL